MTASEHDDGRLPPRKRSVPRPLVWAAEGIGAILAAVILAVVILALRLVVAPLDIGFLTPQLVAWADARLDPYTVTIGKTRLRWQAGRSTIDVEAVDAQLHAPAMAGSAAENPKDGPAVLGTDVLSVSLGLKPLLHERVQPSHVTLTRPHVALVRLEDGSIVLRGTAEAPPPSAQPQPFDWEAARHLMDQLGGARGTSAAPSKDPFARLDRILIERGAVTVDDRAAGAAWALSDTGIVFQRSAEGWSARLNGTASVGQTGAGHAGAAQAGASEAGASEAGASEAGASDSSAVVLDARYSVVDRRIGVSADIASIDPAVWMIGMLKPPSALTALSGIQLPLQLHLDGVANLSQWLLGPVHLTVKGKAGRLVDSRLAQGTLAVASLDLAASYDPGARQASLSRFLLDLDGPTVEVSGRADSLPALFRAPLTQPLPLILDVSLHNLPASRFGTTWPPGVAPNPRGWIFSHLSKGTISDLHAHLAAKWDPQSRQVTLDGAGGTMKLAGFTLDYLPGLTPAYDVEASAVFDQKHFDFSIQSAQLKGLTITGGEAVIGGLEDPDQTIAIDLPIMGPLADIVALLASDRLKLAQRAGLSPDGVSGQVAGTLHFNFPLLGDLPLAKLNYAATANLSAVTLPKVVLHRDLTDGVMKLDLTENLVSAVGTANLDGNPAGLSLSQRVAGSSPEKMRAAVKTTLSSEARARLGLDILPDIVSGPIGVNATYIQREGGQSEADLDLDLSPAKLAITDIDWSKPPGLPASAKLGVLLHNDRLTNINALKASAPGLVAEGDLVFEENNSLRHAVIEELDLAGTQVAGEVDHSGQDWDIRLHGPRVDLSTYLKQLKTAKPTEPGKGPLIHAAIQTDQLVFGNKRALDHANLDVALQGGLSTLHLSGGVGLDKKAAFALDDPSKGGKFSLKSDDFGAVLRIAGIIDNIRGGSLLLQGENHRTNGKRIFTGHVDGHDFRLLDAPVIARLLTVSSPTSILSLLTGNGIPFDVVVGDIRFESGVLNVSDSVAHGSALGLTATGTVNMAANSIDLAGTVVPAYLLNSTIGKLPIVGDILTGGKGKGVFAVNYRLGGSLDHVQVSVNPLSALAPGFLRNFFLFSAPKPAGAAAAPNAAASPAKQP